MVDKRDLRIIEKYVFLGQMRYRIQVLGTNVVLNVAADDDEEAIRKALDMAKKIGLTENVIESLRKHLKYSSE